MVVFSGDTEADSELAIGDLARRIRVLTWRANGMPALLENSGVVDDPRRCCTVVLPSLKGMLGRLQANGSISPPAMRQKVQQLALDVVDLLRVSASASRNRLGALALTVSQYAHGMHCEGIASTAILRVSPDAREEPLETGSPHDFRDLWGHSQPLSLDDRGSLLIRTSLVRAEFSPLLVTLVAHSRPRRRLLCASKRAGSIAAWRRNHSNAAVTALPVDGSLT
jgi:hypothetical protein